MEALDVHFVLEEGNPFGRIRWLRYISPAMTTLLFGIFDLTFSKAPVKTAIERIKVCSNLYAYEGPLAETENVRVLLS